MAKRKDDTVGEWAKVKLGALREYLEFYAKAMKNQSWCRGTVYVDAFAGLGRTEVRARKRGAVVGTVNLFDEIIERDEPQVREVIDGSPRVALSIPNKFARYVFIERDVNRIKALEALRDEFKETHKVSVMQGDCNEELAKIANAKVSGVGMWGSHRGVCFLDPFGMQLSWSTIEMLAATRGLEVFINFPLGMSIQRLLTRDGEMQDGWREALDDFFGSAEWYDLVYEKRETLLGEAIEKKTRANDLLLEWYCARLKAAFGHVAQPRLVKNSNGGHLYYLLWAGPHPLGLKGADYILKHYDKIEKNKVHKASKAKKG